MDHHLLCSWLGLPAGSWPPNHYVLLGLEPGADDPAAIEASVQERMGIVRRYQLAHPDLATEAMNRLAQAMICLTDETARAAYLAESLPQIPSLPPEKTGAAALDGGPPAVDEPSPPAEPVAPMPSEPLQRVAPPPVPSIPLELDAVHTRRDLFFRIARTRQIQHLWDSVGTHLNDPRHRLSRPAEAADLIHHMQALPRLIQSFPSRLGQAGQPGYLVLALARQQLIVPTLQTLLPSQRLALARDWEAGKQYLIDQYGQLRSQSRALRHRSLWNHLVRLTRSLLNNHPGLVVLSISLLALNIAFPVFRQEWHRQLAVICCLIFIRLVLWWGRSRHTQLPIRERALTSRRRPPRKRDRLSSGRADQ
ncbi:MAG TPA: hypothetical protein VGP68_09355 [Gemmataceae bacterium]|nr:hypothetical protein [Gemmataceae bacterium]